MSKNILIIGSYRSEGVDCFDWFQELPNLEDYDTIILDTTRIFNIWDLAGRLEPIGNAFILRGLDDMDRRIISNISLVKRKLAEILYYDVSIYALYTPTIQVNYEDTPASDIAPKKTKYIRNNDWCPISFSPITEKGKTILVKDSSYKDYFTDFQKWEYYIDPDDIVIGELQHYYKDKFKVMPGLEVIATSRAEKPIALSFSLHFHGWTDREHGMYLAGITKGGGNLVLLPVANQQDTSPHFEILLRRGMEVEETPTPSWVNNIEIPGEASCKRELSKGTANLKKAEANVKKLEASLHEIRKYKRLLYDTGLSLQNISKQTLEELGAKIKPSIVTDEFIIEVGNREALIEVKGNTGNVSKRDIAQLITDLGEHLEATDNDIKGILIGNAWRLLPLEDRDIKDKPLFTRNVVRIAENRDIGLISTVELFGVYCKVLEQPDCRSEILDKIIGSKGIIRL